MRDRGQRERERGGGLQRNKQRLAQRGKKRGVKESGTAKEKRTKRGRCERKRRAEKEI